MMVSKYQIIKPINSGKFGSIYLVKDCTSSHMYAMKTLWKNRHDIAPYKNKIMIDNEINNMAKVKGHRNIVTLHEVVEDENAFNLIEDLCGGHTLVEGVRLPGSTDTLRALTDVLKALAYCHEMDVVYGDLKPENIVYSTMDACYKLTDFGSSVPVHSSTKEGVLFFTTPHIAAPEVLDNNSKYNPIVSFQYDVWSFGILLRSMYMHDTFLHHNKSLAHDIESIIRGCLQYNAAQRFTTDKLLDVWQDTILQ